MKQQKYPDITESINIVKSIFGILLDPSLQKSDKYIKKNVDFEITYNSQYQTIFKIIVNHGPFTEIQRVHERTYNPGNDISFEEVVNAVMHALTFEGSPFYFDAKLSRFVKRAQYAG